MPNPSSNELVYSNEEAAAELSAEDTADEATPELDESNPDLDSADEVESTWEDGDPEDPDAETDASAQDEAPAQTVRKIKANGQIVEVDMSDQERVDQILTMGLGARQVYAERDKLRKVVGLKDKAIADGAKYRDLWTKLEEAKAQGRESLYEKIFDEKFEVAAKRWADEQSAYEQATPEQRRVLDMERQLRARLQATEAEAKKRAKADEDVAEKTRKAEIKEARATLMPEFMKHEFSAKVKDPARAERLNRILWRDTIANLKAKHGALESWEEVPLEDIRAAFKETAETLFDSRETKTQAKAEVKKVIDNKKQVAKTQAQAVATRNYQPSIKNHDKEKDPIKLWKKMFRR